jgi:hypothetical protein
MLRNHFKLFIKLNNSIIYKYKICYQFICIVNHQLIYKITNYQQYYHMKN